MKSKLLSHPVAAILTSWNMTSMFSVDDIEKIRKRILDYQDDNHSRSGGAYLLKELQYVDEFKDRIMVHLLNIKDALAPIERKLRVSAEALKKAEQQKAIDGIMLTLFNLPEKVLRQLAEVVIGDTHFNFMVTELPKVIATMQVTGSLSEES